MTDQWMMDDLVCPRDHESFHLESGELRCAKGHRFPVISGVPILLLEDRSQTIDLALESKKVCKPSEKDDLYLETLGISEEEKRGVLELALSDPEIDPAVSYLIGATNGIAYKHLIGRLKEYPIPELRLPDGNGKRFLDIGCNWGRWTIAAARKGYQAMGIDPSLGAIMAARRVCRQLGVNAKFVVGDARFLPLKNAGIDQVFSYSVIQHFSREDAASAIRDVGRVLVRGGEALIQLPTRWGIRCLYHQARRGFREGTKFEVRYWSFNEMENLFASAIGPTQFSVDCYFGIGLQGADRHLMSPSLKCLVTLSDFLQHASRNLRWLKWLADSIYVRSTKK